MAGNSESNKKAAATRKKKNPNVFKEIGALGGAHPKRGYLGKLKDEGRLDELRTITKKGAEATNALKDKLQHKN